MQRSTDLNTSISLIVSISIIHYIYSAILLQVCRYSQYQMEKQNALIRDPPYKNICRLVIIAFFLCLSPSYYGFCLNQTATVSKKIFLQYYGSISVQPVMVGVLIGILPAGGGVGALLAPFFMRHVSSRKNYLLIFNSIAILMAGIIQINNFTVLLVCRFVQGFVIGNFMGSVPAYIKQLTPIPLRGTIGAMSQFIINSSGVIIFALQVIFVKTDVGSQFFWRFMFSFSGVIVIFQSLMLLFNVIPQSPMSLIEQGKLEQAKDTLRIFNCEEAALQVYEQYVGVVAKNKILMQNQSDSGVEKIKVNVQMTQRKTNLIVDQKSIESPKIMEVEITEEKGKTQGVEIKKKLEVTLRTLILAFQLPLMQQFNGNKVITTQSGDILSAFDQNLGLYAPLITNFVQLIATSISFVVITKVGRRPLMLTGNFLLSIYCLVIGAFFLVIFNTGNNALIITPLVIIIIFMLTYGMTVGPLVWLYVPEIIPPRIVPFATFSYWFGVATSVTITPIVIDEVGSPYPLFFFFGGLSFIFFIMNCFLVVETKGLKSTDVQK